MKNEFIQPNFNHGIIELRYENDGICIYGTVEGLKRISDLCLELIKKNKPDHVHLEDYDILTKNSSVGVIALFDKN